METYSEENNVQYTREVASTGSSSIGTVDSAQISQQLQKEFSVVKLIEGYRTRGHLFTKTNPVRDRRTFSPNLDLENFGLSSADMNTVFDAAKLLGMPPASLSQIIDHLTAVYCQHIGVEYMYIRNPKIIQWIQEKLNVNDNKPNFTNDQKIGILNKLNQAVSFENFLHTKYVGQKRFSLEGGESIIPALDALIERAAENGSQGSVAPQGPQRREERHPRNPCRYRR